MLKLKRLKINKFRHVEPTELVFDDRYTVPLGLNGSGKTTLLKLISACIQSNFSDFKDEEFAIEYEFDDRDSSISVDVRNQRLQFAEAGSLISSIINPSHSSRERTARPSFRSTAVVTMLASECPKLVARSHHGTLHLKIGELPEEESSLDVDLPTEGSFLRGHLYSALFHAEENQLPHAPRLLARWINLAKQGEECFRFDESLEILNAVVGKPKSDTDAPTRALFDITVHLGRESDRGLSFVFVPEVLLGLAYDVSSETIESGFVIFESKNVDFLERFSRAARFDEGQIIFNLTNAAKNPNESIFSFSNATFRFSAGNGTTITHELLSYGQKRLLSFLYYVACNEAVVVADELINGLHHAWIETCLDAIGERQAFLTSQNPILLDFLPPASPEEAQRRFIRCVPEEREGRDVMVWRNLTADEATELCANYAAGIQQLSDLLRIQGLW